MTHFADIPGTELVVRRRCGYKYGCRNMWFLFAVFGKPTDQNRGAVPITRSRNRRDCVEIRNKLLAARSLGGGA